MILAAFFICIFIFVLGQKSGTQSYAFDPLQTASLGKAF
jgi:hypothetical protein